MALNKKQAIRLAKACKWAYRFEPSQEKDLLSDEGLEPIQTIKISDNQNVSTSFAGVIEYEKFVVVVFQGTITEFGVDGVFRIDSLVDWLENFKIRQVATNISGLPGDVHLGFLAQLNLVYDQVKNAIPGGKTKPLVVTGHSQGGAVAVLATKKFELDGYKIKDTYTFAAPRCGDTKFVRSLKTKVQRIEFGHDIVPHVPPTLTHSTFFQKALKAASFFFELPDILEAFASMLKRLKANSYASAGNLTYRPDDGPIIANLTNKDETRLFKARRKKLIRAGKDLGRHHGISNYINMFS